ncbi:MAG: hypothetical protein R2733_14020 [Acidimicrobiales bacterium]
MSRLTLTSAAFAAVLALSACGGGSSSAGDEASDTETTTAVADDAESSDSTEDAESDSDSSDSGSSDASSGEGESDDGGDSSGATIRSLDDLPSECRDAIGDFLRTIEPTVSEIDWENATLADMEEIGTALDEPGTEFETRMADAGCEDIQPDSDEESVALMIELAEQEAPGTVGFLTFISSFATSFDEGAAASSDVPADCDGAIAYVEGLMADSESMMELPMSEMVNVTAAMEVITSECSLEESAAFLEDNTAFFGG